MILKKGEGWNERVEVVVNLAQGLVVGWSAQRSNLVLVQLCNSFPVVPARILVAPSLPRQPIKNCSEVELGGLTFTFAVTTITYSVVAASAAWDR